MRGVFKFLGFLVLTFLFLSVIGGIYRLFSDSETNIKDSNIAVIEIEGIISSAMPVLSLIHI